MAPFNNNIIFYRDTLNMARLSLGLHKLRTLLSLLGICCGVMAVLTTIAIGEGARRETMIQIERMGITNIFIQTAALSQDQLDRLTQRRSPGLKPDDLIRLEKGCTSIVRTAASRVATADLTVSGVSQLAPKIIGCGAAYGGILQLGTASGRFISDLDDKRKNLVCVLGWQVSKALGMAGKVGQSLRIGDEIWKVVGILNRYDTINPDTGKFSMQNVNEMIFLPLSSSLALPGENYGLESEGISLSEVIIEIDRQENVLAAAEVIGRIMKHDHNDVDDFRIIVPLELLARSEKIQGVFNLVFTAVGTISLLIGGIGIMNIMLAGVSERTREIGLRLAVGATELHIMTQFLVEALLITVGGGIAGVFAGIGAAVFIGSLAGWPVSITLKAVLIPLLVSIAVGLFFGLFPAVRAAKLDPATALGSFN